MLPAHLPSTLHQFARRRQPRFHQILPPYHPRDSLETSINMDKDRAFPQMGHGNIRVSSSPSSTDPEDALFESIFDWPAFCKSPQETDVQSDSLNVDDLISNFRPLIDSYQTHNSFNMGSPIGSDSEAFTTPGYSSHPSPPELVEGEGSTSPSDHSDPWNELRDDASLRRQPSISLEDFREHDDQWTYPQAEPVKAIAQNYPVDGQVRTERVAGHRAPYQVAESGLKKRRRSPDKRQRQLSNPLQTAEVRRSGACVPCRLSKIRCFDNGSCPTCRKSFPDHSHLVCTRLTPAQAWPVMCKAPDIWSKSPGLERELCQASHLWVGTPRQISILFSRDPASPKLDTVAQAYSSGDGDDNFRKISFHREHVPSYEALRFWVEQMIQAEAKPMFESALQRFLLRYTREGVGLLRHRLVSNVHMLNCFFRIWKTATFWCKDPSQKLVNLPMSMQAILRNIVRSGIQSIELDILKELEECLAQQGALKQDERMAIWACMWQIILIYRDLQQGWRSWLGQMSQVWSRTEMEPYYRDHKAIESFFPLITVFYHYQFRTKKSLEVSMPSCSSKTLQEAARDLVSHRPAFCQRLQESEDETDKLLCILVVNHELKKLNARKRAPKNSTKARRGALDENCDDDDE